MTRLGVSRAAAFVVVTLALVARTAIAVHPDRCDPSAFDQLPSEGYYSTANRPCSGDAADVCFLAVNSTATLHPVVMVFPEDPSNITTDYVTRFAEDELWLVVDVPISQYNVTAVFPQGNQACADAWTQDEPLLFDSDATDCFYRHQFHALWRDIFERETGGACGFVTGETTDELIYDLDFAVNVRQDLLDERELTGLYRESESSLPVRITFPRQVNITVDNVGTLSTGEFTNNASTIFDPPNVQGGIFYQLVEFNDTSGLVQMELRLFTSVQFPFKILNNAIFWHWDQSRHDLVTPRPRRLNEECNDNDGTGQACINLWQMVWAARNQIPQVCDFTYEPYILNFTLDCVDGVFGDNVTCPLDDNTDDVVVTFSVESTDHCPDIIDNVGVIGDMATYETGCVTEAECVGQHKTGFIDGQTAFFRARVRSAESSLSHTVVRRVIFQRGVQELLVYVATDPNVGEGEHYQFTTTDGGPTNVTVAGDQLWSYPLFSLVLDTRSDTTGTLDLRPNVLRLNADERVGVNVIAEIDVFFEGNVQGGASGSNFKTMRFEWGLDQVVDDAVSEAVRADMVRTLSESEATRAAAVAPNFRLQRELKSLSLRFDAAGSQEALGGARGAGEGGLSTTTIIYAAVGAGIAFIATVSTLIVVARRRKFQPDEEEYEEYEEEDVVDDGNLDDDEEYEDDDDDDDGEYEDVVEEDDADARAPPSVINVNNGMRDVQVFV